MRTVSFGYAMKPAEVPRQAEPAPSRTRADTCHAPCHRSRDPGHERVVTGTNPAARDCRRRSTLVARAHGLPDRTPPAPSEGWARARRNHLGQHRRPETFCAASLPSLSLDGAYSAVGAISHHFWRDGGSARGAQHILSSCSHVLRIRIDPEAQQPVACRVHLPPPARAAGQFHDQHRSPGDVAAPHRPPIPSRFLATSALPRGDFDSRGGVGLPNVPKGARGPYRPPGAALHGRKSLTQRDDSICPDG